MKLLRILLIGMLIAAGFAFAPTHSVDASSCVSASGGYTGFTYWGPLTMPAGSSISVIMTTDAGAGTYIGIWTQGVYQVYSVVYDSQSINYTLPADATDVYVEISFQYNRPSDFYSVNAGCPGGRDMVSVPSQAVVGEFVTNTELLNAPDASAGTGIVMDIGKTLWVFGVDSSGMYYQVMMSGSLLWVPVSSMGPNFDDVWNGTPLPTTVVN